MKSIKNIVKETVLTETNSTIKIDESHFFSVLVEPKNKKKFLNFLILFTALIISVIVIINSLMFFINDVLLYPNTPTINKQGAIIPERSCNRQSVLFLLNSAERWANTGIQLQKGDEIKISYSGGFNSDVAGLKKSALINDTLKYKWVNFTNTESPSDTLLLKKDGYFGSVLYTTASELGVRDDDKDNFHQIKKDKSIKIKRNGTLFLSVNDIYLTDNIIIEYENRNKNKLPNVEFLSLADFNKIGGKDSIGLYWAKDTNTVYVAGEAFQKHFQKNRDAFFNDNLGEVLVLIDINRKINFFTWRTSWYRYTENTINSFWDNSTGWFIPFIYSIGFFIWAIIVLFFYRLSFITIPIIILFFFPFLKKYFLKLKNIKS